MRVGLGENRAAKLTRPAGSPLAAERPKRCECELASAPRAKPELELTVNTFLQALWTQHLQDEIKPADADF